MSGVPSIGSSLGGPSYWGGVSFASLRLIVAVSGMPFAIRASVASGVPGIEADCGGACACATCHVFVEPGWLEKTGKRNSMEEDMLDFAFDVRDNSRLSCQIKISDALDGLRVRVPEKQF